MLGIITAPSRVTVHRRVEHLHFHVRFSGVHGGLGGSTLFFLGGHGSGREAAEGITLSRSDLEEGVIRDPIFEISRLRWNDSRVVHDEKPLFSSKTLFCEV